MKCVHCTTDTQLTSNESRTAGELPWTMQNTRTSKVQKSMALGVVSCRVVSRHTQCIRYSVQCTHARDRVHATFDTCIRFQHQDRLLFTRSKDEHSRKLTELYKMKRNKLPFAHAIFTNLIFFQRLLSFYFYRRNNLLIPVS